MLLFEVEGVANLTARKIWNLEDALGWAGGIMGIVTLIVQCFVSPFIANNMAIAVSAATVQGQKLQISSNSFYLRNVFESIFSCGCTKRFLRRSKTYRR